ncbi:hypothetical protein K431DRAFT_347668 [Polychaeton citri CBS 116435]|uniref:Zn(2)-C6 fungal-type domain-containing protein n=1 Tax=Polychaeton citri CBS 116435 TaxID=1314669 RepID=A0A9P4UNF2_9PEZI|nr:hypothetical protein K431DRAFT_347668 [Polychaeton citri CBS 116435]
MTNRNKCNVCRMRKIKCDGAKPICSHCRLGGRPCNYAPRLISVIGHDRPLPTGLTLRSTHYPASGCGIFHTFASNQKQIGTTTIRTKAVPPILESKTDSDDCSKPLRGLDGDSEREVLPSLPPYVQRLQLSSSRSTLHLSSPTAYRQQLKELLLDNEFPSETVSRSELVNVYSQWFNPQGSAMQATIDCILLLYLARLSGDTRLHHEAQTLHVSAIEKLRTEIQVPSAARSDGILGAIDTLAIIGQFREVTPTNDHWVTHVEGLESLFKARGPSALLSQFAKTVLFNFLPVALIKALNTRQPLFLGDFRWQAAMAIHCTSVMSRLALIASRLPALLAEVDQLALQYRRSCLANSVMSVVDDCGRDKAREKLETWVMAWCIAFSPSPGLNYSTATLEERFPKFVQRFGHFSFIFPFALPYSFDGVLDAFHHAWYWMCLLEAEQAVLDVIAPTLNENEQFMATEPSPTRRKVLKKCNRLAQSICRAVPYLYSAAQPYAETAICTAVTHAERCYEKNGCRVEAEWCQGVRNNLEDRNLNTALQGDLSCVKRVFAGWPVFVHPT